MTEENKLFYKFRNLESVFDYKELENQEIYFALPEELNDPMDCQPNIVSKGDNIVWLNFLRHFLINLTKDALILDCIDKQIIPFSKDYFYMNNIFSLKQNEYFNSIYIDVYSYLEKDLEDISTMLSLCKKPISKEFVIILLFKIMNIYLMVLFKYTKKVEIELNAYNECISELKKIYNKFQNDDNKNFYDFFKKIYNDVSIYFINNNYNKKYFALDFFMNYINRLEELLFPDVRISSFSEIYHNTLMWSHYADNHKGICLIFNSIKQHNEYGFKMYLNKSIEPIIYPFNKIKYSTNKKEINLFKNIFIAHSNDFKKFWYYHPTNNQKSKYYIEYSLTDSEEMLKFADTFLNNYYIKSLEWEYENEYRLFILPVNSNDKTVYYDFSSLNGIIFGIKTPLKDKLKIIDIIKDKCKKENRDNFNFYQAYYNSYNKQINTYLIDNKLFMEYK